MPGGPAPAPTDEQGKDKNSGGPQAEDEKGRYARQGRKAMPTRDAAQRRALRQTAHHQADDVRPARIGSVPPSWGTFIGSNGRGPSSLVRS